MAFAALAKMSRRLIFGLCPPTNLTKNGQKAKKETIFGQNGQKGQKEPKRGPKTPKKQRQRPFLKKAFACVFFGQKRQKRRNRPALLTTARQRGKRLPQTDPLFLAQKRPKTTQVKAFLEAEGFKKDGPRPQSPPPFLSPGAKRRRKNGGGDWGRGPVHNCDQNWPFCHPICPTFET